MQASFLPIRPLPRFAASPLDTSNAESIKNTVKALIPGVSAQDLTNIVASVNQADYKLAMAGVMANGNLALVTWDTTDTVGDGTPGIYDPDAPQRAPFKVFYGSMNQLTEHAATDALSGAGCTDFYFEDGFTAGMNVMFPSITVNGQKAVKTLRAVQ